jgi:hypothetical protein
MDNKKVGSIIIIVSIILLLLLIFVRQNVVQAYQAEIDRYVDAGEACPSDPNICPHEQRSQAQIPIFIAGALLIGIMSLGIYILFFDKSQKEILSTLANQKTMQLDHEKFDILMKALSTEEQKIMLAVKEQDGITQQTLRLRTDMHKSKLSIVLDGLEKKNLIAKKPKGKTNQIFLKIAL